MKQINSSIIGSTDIAEAHILAMNSIGINLNEIATRNGSKNLEKLRKKYNINQLLPKDWKTLISTTNSNLIVIATNSNLHEEISGFSLDSGKHVLCEKPGWYMKDINRTKNLDFLRFSYNRRFYSWVLPLKNILSLSKNKIKLTLDLVEYKEDFDKYYEITSHYIDLVNFLLGDKLSDFKNNIYMAKNFLQINTNFVEVNYHVWDNPSSNYRIRIQDKFNYYEIMPIEICSIFSGFKINSLSKFDNSYTPFSLDSISESSDKNLKFGFQFMYQDVINWINGSSNILCTFEEEIKNRYIANKIFEQIDINNFS